VGQRQRGPEVVLLFSGGGHDLRGGRAGLGRCDSYSIWPLHGYTVASSAIVLKIVERFLRCRAVGGADPIARCLALELICR